MERGAPTGSDTVDHDGVEELAQATSGRCVAHGSFEPSQKEKTWTSKNAKKGFVSTWWIRVEIPRQRSEERAIRCPAMSSTMQREGGRRTLPIVQRLNRLLCPTIQRDAAAQQGIEKDACAPIIKHLDEHHPGWREHPPQALAAGGLCGADADASFPLATLVQAQVIAKGKVAAAADTLEQRSHLHRRRRQMRRSSSNRPNSLRRRKNRPKSRPDYSCLARTAKQGWARARSCLVVVEARARTLAKGGSSKDVPTMGSSSDKKGSGVFSARAPWQRPHLLCACHRHRCCPHPLPAAAPTVAEASEEDKEAFFAAEAKRKAEEAEAAKKAEEEKAAVEATEMLGGGGSGPTRTMAGGNSRSHCCLS